MQHLVRIDIGRLSITKLNMGILQKNYTMTERSYGMYLAYLTQAALGFNVLIALLYIGYAYQHENWQTSLAGTFIGGFIIIINWATIWDTYEFFIFDSREKYQRKKLLNKIIDGEIQVVPLMQDR